MSIYSVVFHSFIISFFVVKLLRRKKNKKSSHAGTRTRVGEVKTRYPNRLDYMGLRFSQNLTIRHVFPNPCFCLSLFFWFSIQTPYLKYALSLPPKFQTASPKLSNERHKTQRREKAGLPRESNDFRLILVQPITITKSYGIYVFLCQECWLYTQTYKILLITLSAPFDS